MTKQYAHATSMHSDRDEQFERLERAGRSRAVGTVWNSRLANPSSAQPSNGTA
ncbi:MAG: hypothetical protein QM783_10780 [Phycisphaerales bacterium]